MKLNKREKNSLIIILIFQVWLIILSLYFLFSYIMPNFDLIKVKKEQTTKLYNNIVELESKWINYKTFKSLNKNIEDEYLKNVLTSLTEKFYNDHFINTDQDNFERFISNKISEMTSEENQQLLLLQNEKITKILPSYIINNNDSTEKNVLTNFKFINYVEKIVNTFNLKTTDKIWINNVEVVSEYENLNSNTNLDVSIFEIPLKLNLSWNKKWILYFLHFAYNVWNIKITEDDDIIVNSDDFFSKYTVLKWDEYKSDYNIYENQIFDIEYINMGKYIDWSTNQREEISLYDFIIEYQGSESYNIDIKLNFYVKWIEQYELISFISSVLEQYDDLKARVSKQFKDLWTENYDVNISNAYIYLDDNTKNMQNFEKQLWKKEKLDTLYSKLIEYEKKFKQIEAYLNK